jgi:hypothetical protein
MMRFSYGVSAAGDQHCGSKNFDGEFHFYRF